MNPNHKKGMQRTCFSGEDPESTLAGLMANFGNNLLILVTREEYWSNKNTNKKREKTPYRLSACLDNLRSFNMQSESITDH